jgi:hypothetical protein
MTQRRGSVPGEGSSGGVPPVSPRSYWLGEALRADPGAPCPALAGDVVADVCVVGGGCADRSSSRSPGPTRRAIAPRSRAGAAACCLD